MNQVDELSLVLACSIVAAHSVMLCQAWFARCKSAQFQPCPNSWPNGLAYLVRRIGVGLEHL